MKKYFVVLLSLVLITPFFVSAVQEAQKMTLEQKGEFKSVLHIDANDFAVPTIIDVPISFDDGVVEDVAVVDEQDNIIPHIIVGSSTKRTLEFSAKDSFEMDTTSNIVDDNLNTFVEYPFVEGKNEEGEYIISTMSTCADHCEYLQVKIAQMSEKNVVEIDVYSSEMFYSDSFTLFFDKHISYPTNIRVATIDEAGNEKIIVPEKAFNQRAIIFPEEYADHYRIKLKYDHPLRINEIIFSDTKPPTTSQKFVRFIAKPGESYDIYYNTKTPVKMYAGEMPKLNIQKEANIISVKPSKNNLLYKKADTDGDGIVDNADNCVKVSNIDQQDLDKNGVGDACEDFDKDGVINTKDNCPDVPNHYQKDEDVDGIGDVCDGEESRFMEKYPWISYVVLAIVFVVVAGLIIKTLRNEE
jgi:hypothetical protein